MTAADEHRDDLRAHADAAVRAVIATQYGRSVPAMVLVDAVAGAGKTTVLVELVSRLVPDPAVPELAVSANTDGQSFEIVARLLAAGCPTVLFAKTGKALPGFEHHRSPPLRHLQRSGTRRPVPARVRRRP